MCAASPARNSRPCCIGSTTKLRIPVTPFSRIGPSLSVQPSSPSRAWSSSQIRSSGHVVDVLVRRALQVEPGDAAASACCAARSRARARRRSAPRSTGPPGEDAEPAERVLAREPSALRAGMLSRQMPWKPSQPATTSQLELDAPSPACTVADDAGAPTRARAPTRPRPRRWSGRPVSSRAAIRSFTTSCCP